jgi:hypothetical protein
MLRSGGEEVSSLGSLEPGEMSSSESEESKVSGSEEEDGLQATTLVPEISEWHKTQLRASRDSLILGSSTETWSSPANPNRPRLGGRVSVGRGEENVGLGDSEDGESIDWYRAMSCLTLGDPPLRE